VSPIGAVGGSSPDAIWNADTKAHAPQGADITLIEGTTFCVSGEDGEIRSLLPQGLFVDDTRILSGWRTRVNGLPIEPLAAEIESGHRATLIGRVRRDRDLGAEGSLVIERRRTVTTGLTEITTLHNYARIDADVMIEMRFESDFADIFDVKASRRRTAQRPRRSTGNDRLVFEDARHVRGRGLVLHTGGGRIKGSRVIYRVRVPARGTWSQSLHLAPTMRGHEQAMEPPDLEHLLREVERVPVEWHARTPRTVSENVAISEALMRGQSDIEALRILDPESPQRTVIAAGAPWYMALFGRDSILTSIMTLPVDADIALGTLRSLGDRQGRAVDLVTEEQPGRILHEVRLGSALDMALRGNDTYFGSVDATPLYVVAVEELSRWGVAPADLDDLLIHADRCLTWIEEYGDRDRDGFVEYERSSPQGLVNQGWKDSWDAIQFADGAMASTPIALCEVQAYVYAAYRARARLALSRGDSGLARDLESKAERLKSEFNERFWLPEHQYFALALDGNKEPVDACASNMGHCLWSGIVDEDKAGYVAERLLAPDMFSGWGIRTLSSDMAAYDPVSYHNGSIWPHDNALIVAGLMRYGYVEKAQRVAMALFDAARHFGGRLPELFCGFPRYAHEYPVPYPNACTPQAWAAATPFSLVRTLLRLDVDVVGKRMRIDPALPSELGSVRIENLLVGGARVDIDVASGKATVSGLPRGFTIEAAGSDHDADEVR
jgi:glycogen debranching enzyme